MNVGQLRAAIANLPDHLPVVIDQEDLDLVGEYVEVMQVRFTDTDVYFDPEAFSLDGSRPYDRAIGPLTQGIGMALAATSGAETELDYYGGAE